MSDAALLGALREALGPGVALRGRRPFPYTSSLPLEELELDGPPHRLLFKDLSPAPRPSRPAFLVDPRRELEAYTLLGGLDLPALYGAVADGRRTWLFLEVVDGVPLWQAPGLAPWEAAARWLARLHARPVPTGRHLLVHDAAHLGRWLPRAGALRPEARELGPAAERAIALLAALPRVPLHGECYASNVLVQDGARIRPVDWETAGAGPGVLDLGALTAGAFPGDEPARIVAAYRAALPPALRPADDALHAARLVVALQWLGWSPTWEPPAEHAHDWLADARAAAEALGA